MVFGVFLKGVHGQSSIRLKGRTMSQGKVRNNLDRQLSLALQSEFRLHLEATVPGGRSTQLFNEG
jgi:hypothetical protein